MAGVTIKKATVLNNPAPFGEPFRFEITYEAIQDLDEDLEWKVIYISSPNDVSLDQELENVLVGPVSAGTYKFVLEADGPDGTKVPLDDLIGNTGVVLSCSFNGQEFIRVGFIMYVDYTDEDLKENPPETPLYEKLVRNVAVDDPRVTTRPLDIDLPEPSPDAPPLPEIPEEQPTEVSDPPLQDTNPDASMPQSPAVV